MFKSIIRSCQKMFKSKANLLSKQNSETERIIYKFCGLHARLKTYVIHFISYRRTATPNNDPRQIHRPKHIRSLLSCTSSVDI